MSAAEAPPDTDGARVVAKDVRRVFPGSIVAVDGVSLSAEPGELVALTGPSGSGKTTLLSIIGGLERATSGSVQVDGAAIESWRPDRFHREVVGFAFQHHYLIAHLSAQANVEIPLIEGNLSGAERSERASELLEAVGLRHKRDALAAHLSGGERQRVAVARALVNRPRLLLADEPTGSLGGEDTQRVLELLEEARAQRGTTVIVVTHGQEVIDLADRALEMRDGRLAPDWASAYAALKRREGGTVTPRQAG